MITVIAIICLAGACEEVFVTDSNLTEGLNMMQCSNGQPALAKWKSEHPIYRSDRYSISGYKCVLGYQVKGRA